MKARKFTLFCRDRVARRARDDPGLRAKAKRREDYQHDSIQLSMPTPDCRASNSACKRKMA